MNEQQTKKEAPAGPNPKDAQSDSQGKRIAIIGGGITGLFCAYMLAEDGHSIQLFESSGIFGGRLRSLRLTDDLLKECANTPSADCRSIADRATLEEALRVPPGPPSGDHLEFCAEFGAMRVELDVQVLLKFLLKHLNIGEANLTSLDSQAQVTSSLEWVHMESFSPFTSPASVGDPVYELKPEEEGKSPLELLSLGICRTIVYLTFDKPASNPGFDQCEDFETKQSVLVDDLAKAAGTHRPTGPVFEDWLKGLRESDYWVIQRYGRTPILHGPDQEYVDLYRMGFWNLLAGYLSHNALSKVRDLGTFYHLLPENPNAAEWLTWWLRQFSISSQLQGIFGGMQSITEKLENIITKNYPQKANPVSPAKSQGRGGSTVALNSHLEVTDVVPCEKATNKVQLTVKRTDDTSMAEKTFTDESDDPMEFDRVIIALPKAPAEKLAAKSQLLGQAHTAQTRAQGMTLADLLYSALGFPMVKIFFVVRERWWEQTKRANWGATRYPTREVHFYKGRVNDSRRGMVMLYTDRPASSFWANYVPAGHQLDVDELCATSDDRKILRARLKSRIVQYINEAEGPGLTVDDIIWCGIMDWGRLPYGAANHAWRPEYKYWEVMAELGDMELGSDAKGPHVHICGEAYSDYHGFIEGSLRSAFYALTRIKPASTSSNEARVEDILHRLGANIKSTRDKKYVNDLIAWINNLELLRDVKPRGDDGDGDTKL